MKKSPKNKKVIVKIYYDPLTELDLEGRASIEHLELEPKGYFTIAKVKFISGDPKPVFRKIRTDGKNRKQLNSYIYQALAAFKPKY